MPNPMRSRRILLDNPPSPYLVRDEFTTARAAGTLNSTLCEPGPGDRLVIDSNNYLSISGGKLTASNGLAGFGNPLCGYPLTTRQVGQMFIGRGVSAIANGLEFGTATYFGVMYHSIRLAGTTVSARLTNPLLVAVGTISLSTEYNLVIALRALGCMYLIKGGAFSNWTLLYLHNVDSVGEIHRPLIGAIGVSTQFTVDGVRIPSAMWLPTPLISDGFSNVFGLSDGKGHAEGVSGGVGAGGAGVAWSNSVGTWVTVDGRLQAGVMVGDQAIATVDTGKADVLGAVKMTRAAGVTSLIVRYVDADNYVRATHNGTNAQLVKRVAGVDTTLINTAATYVAGAAMRIICRGQTFHLYYNDVLIGSAQTIADAALQTGTRQGVHTTSDTNSFDDFLVYASGSGGEYAILDGF